MAGWLVPPTEAVHVSFGNVLGDDRKMLRSRTGDSVKLIELLDEAVERAAAAIAEKNPDLSDDERAALARTIGIGAVKYADLSTDRIKDYVFDWDRMLAFDGNTAPYLQYAHARICSIFRRAEVDRASVRSAAVLPRHAAGAGARPAPAGVPDSARRRRSNRSARTSSPRTCTTWRRTSRRSTSTARSSRPTSRSARAASRSPT